MVKFQAPMRTAPKHVAAFSRVSVLVDRVLKDERVTAPGAIQRRWRGGWRRRDEIVFAHGRLGHATSGCALVTCVCGHDESRRQQQSTPRTET
jgi:hypothetical protein